MTKKNSETNQLIDIFKLFFAICVVAIHTRLLYGVRYGYMLKSNIYRLGVPFFFICSGYFLADKVVKNKYNLPKYIKDNFINYALWCLAYALIYQFLLVKPFDWNLFLIDIKNIFYFSTTTVFWFLSVLIVFAIIILHFKDSKKLNYICILSIIFYLVGLSFTTYRYLFINSRLQVFSDFFLKNYVNNRYFLFMLIFPFLGYYIRKYNIFTKLRLWQVVGWLILFWGLMILETFVFYDKTFEFNEYDFFLFMPLVTSFLFILLNKISIKLPFNTKIFRSLSMSIYYYHFTIIWTYYRYKSDHPDSSIVSLCSSHSSLYFLFILGATIICILIIKVGKKLIKKSLEIWKLYIN